MKKIVVMFALLAFVASGALAAPFTPEVLKLSAPTSVKYDFDGKELSLPVTVAGPGGTGFFLLFTKDKGPSIGNVINGYLGWHEVNKIDTCMYISVATPLVRGNNTIKWNGKGEGDTLVPAGTYTYYLFAIDTNTLRSLVTKQITFGSMGKVRDYVTKDATGKNLAQPIIYIPHASKSGTPLSDFTIAKWTIGNDPEDATLRETTMAKGYTWNPGGLAWNNLSRKYFYFNTCEKSTAWHMRKYEWVPNGSSIQDVTWADKGEYILTGKFGASLGVKHGAINVGNDMLVCINSDYYTSTESQMVFVDINDGTELRRFDMSPWWIDLNDGTATAKGQNSGGPNYMWMQNNLMFLGSHTTCVNMLWDPFYENDKDAVKWVNTNGDYTGDHNYEPNSPKAWVCNDYNVGPYKYDFSPESNMFSIFPSFDMGAVSFGVYAPDGTGMGYIALAGETAYQKYGAEFVDYGSAYDGIYTTSNVGRTTAGVDVNFYYVAHDSFKGTIGNEIGVADAAPAAFSVAQNTPNPFNPSTTISFTLAKAGKVTVDVFNVAGQKIDTVANASMTAGTHSVVWNASKVSAGVYFCTVKSGNLSKTIRMTLLK